MKAGTWKLEDFWVSSKSGKFSIDSVFYVAMISVIRISLPMALIQQEYLRYSADSLAVMEPVLIANCKGINETTMLPLELLYTINDIEKTTDNFTVKAN